MSNVRKYCIIHKVIGPLLIMVALAAGWSSLPQQSDLSGYDDRPGLLASVDNGAFLMVAPDGELQGWGMAQYGLFGDGHLGREKPIPYFMRRTILQDIQFVTAGDASALLLDGSGTLWALGEQGYLNRPAADARLADLGAPAAVMEDVVHAAAGAKHALAVQSDGTLWSWGYNGQGQLGIGTADNRVFDEPQLVMDGVARAYACWNISFAVKENGDLYVWGSDDSTLNRTAAAFTPTRAAGGVAEVTLALGGILVRMEDGSCGVLRGSGYGDDQGEPALLPAWTPEPIRSLCRFGALGESGTLYRAEAWEGQLELTPMADDVAAAGSTYMYLTKDGTVVTYNGDYTYSTYAIDTIELPMITLAVILAAAGVLFILKPCKKM